MDGKATDDCACSGRRSNRSSRFAFAHTNPQRRRAADAEVCARPTQYQKASTTAAPSSQACVVVDCGVCTLIAALREMTRRLNTTARLRSSRPSAWEVRLREGPHAWATRRRRCSLVVDVDHQGSAQIRDRRLYRARANRRHRPMESARPTASALEAEDRKFCRRGLPSPRPWPLGFVNTRA